MVSSPLTLTALLTVHNEEKQLPDCLASLTFADEVLVVLDKCTDASKDIALAAGARVIEGSWELQGDRRMAGIEACQSLWIFEIDADERVPPDLATEIRQVVESSEADYHLIPVDNYIGGRLVRYGWGASFGKAAYYGLFRKGKKTWGNTRVHPPIQLEGKKGAWLNNRLIHYVDDSIEETIERLNRYSSKRARDLVDSGRIGSLVSNLRRIISRFWKCYVIRKGYKEGGYGFILALCAALFPLLSYLKARILLEQKQK